jgi:DNA polymerase-3 subunit gamma/tau
VSAGPSLYRRHRPRGFSDVVGQEHVVRTLRNAIEQNKVHHAYLFVGSRGTGKTSMAKILAACLNCASGPTTEPCGTCEACLAIQNATSLDVIEMDAASHNKVEDIRDLRESVAFAPVSGRSKVYILDEAHMLTTQASNALLKTLEEPPPNTIFVLATTEAKDILPTVVDRCHRFDFSRPTVDQLSRVLQRVADSESIQIAPDALALLARHATGSFRDALGTLEQLVTYTGTQIETADVLAVLGVADEDVLFGALDAVASHDAAAALEAAARFAATGRDLAIAARDLEVHARELLVVRTLGRVPEELSVTPDRDARLAEQAARVPEADLVRLLDLLATALRAVKDGADPRTHLELALVKTATPQVDASAKALLARIERLERGGVAAAPAPEAGASAASQTAAAPSERAPRAPDQPASGVTSAASGGERPSRPPIGGENVRSPDSAHAAPPSADAAVLIAQAEAASPAAPGSSPAAPAVAAAPASPATHEPAAAPQPPGAPAVTVAVVAEVWPAIVDTVSGESSMLGAALGSARPVEIVDGALVVAFPESEMFNRRIAAENAEHRRLLGEALRAFTGATLRLAYEIRELERPSAEAPLADEELVARLVQEFDAEEIVPEPSEETP